MNRLFAYLSAFAIASMPTLAWAQNAVPEHAQEALEHAVDEAVEIPADSTVHAATEGAHGSSGLPQFNTETWAGQIFWLVISFTVLYVVFSKFILPSMKTTIENRTDKIRDDIQTAEALSARAEEIRTGYEAELRAAAGKASSDMKAIDEEAKDKLATALADFKTRQDAELDKVDASLEQSKQAAMGDMQKIAAEIAAKAAEKIAGIPADQSQAETVVQSIKNKAA